jgi:hypothetical protein
MRRWREYFAELLMGHTMKNRNGKALSSSSSSSSWTRAGNRGTNTSRSRDYTWRIKNIKAPVEDNIVAEGN